MLRLSSPTPPLAFWLVMAGIVGLVVWWSVVQRRRTAANLRALAQRLGLNFIANAKDAPPATSVSEEQPGGGSLRVRVVARTTFLGPRSTGPLVAGQRDGRDVAFYTFTTGSGKSRVDWRAVAVQPRATGGLTFHLQREGLATKLKALVGAHEIEVGDAAFDAAWFVQTNEPEFLRAALVPEVRTKLMAAHADARGGAHFQLQLAGVVYAEHGSFADATHCARFERLLPLLNDLADLAEVSAERGA